MKKILFLLLFFIFTGFAAQKWYDPYIEYIPSQKTQQGCFALGFCNGFLFNVTSDDNWLPIIGAGIATSVPFEGFEYFANQEGYTDRDINAKRLLMIAGLTSGAISGKVVRKTCQKAYWLARKSVNALYRKISGESEEKVGLTDEQQCWVKKEIAAAFRERDARFYAAHDDFRHFLVSSQSQEVACQTDSK